jgi:glutamate--cysteine ligase catalytic subunit
LKHIFETGGPYGGNISEFNKVESNMRKRRQEVQAMLGSNERVYSLTAFPRLGCDDFTFPATIADPENSVSRSLFWPDAAIFNGHPRFSTLTSNIRQRRGEKVAINIPIFMDEKTKDPHEELLERFGPELTKAALPHHIYMDAMGFGMGMSCLQLTFQACNLTEAECLYDQLAPLCPILLALTAANPVLRGYLAATDCRWDIIAGSVDCRTQQERSLEPLEGSKFGAIPKSRYDSISSYLSDCSLQSNYNDVPLVYDPEAYKKLKAEGINELMAKHISHLFIRDTVSLFSEKVDQDDQEDTDHFENIQSTNWYGYSNFDLTYQLINV